MVVVTVGWGGAVYMPCECMCIFVFACVCGVWLAWFDQSASIQGLPVGTVKGSKSARPCRLEAGKPHFQAKLFPPVLARWAWAQLLIVDWGSMASIFWKFYVEIQGVFFVCPPWLGFSRWGLGRVHILPAQGTPQSSTSLYPTQLSSVPTDIHAGEKPGYDYLSLTLFYI